MLEYCIFAIAFEEKQVRSIEASIAQLVEQLICNQLVGGSSPSAGSLLISFETIIFGGAPELESRGRL